VLQCCRAAVLQNAAYELLVLGYRCRYQSDFDSAAVVRVLMLHALSCTFDILALIGCCRRLIIDPGADTMLTQPRSLKAKCNNEFGVRNRANEIPVRGSKVHRLQQPGDGARASLFQASQAGGREERSSCHRLGRGWKAG